MVFQSILEGPPIGTTSWMDSRGRLWMLELDSGIGFEEFSARKRRREDESWDMITAIHERPTDATTSQLIEVIAGLRQENEILTRNVLQLAGSNSSLVARPPPNSLVVKPLITELLRLRSEIPTTRPSPLTQVYTDALDAFTVKWRSILTHLPMILKAQGLDGGLTLSARPIQWNLVDIVSRRLVKQIELVKDDPMSQWVPGTEDMLVDISQDMVSKPPAWKINTLKTLVRHHQFINKIHTQPLLPSSPSTTMVAGPTVNPSIICLDVHLRLSSSRRVSGEVYRLVKMGLDKVLECRSDGDVASRGDVSLIGFVEHGEEVSVWVLLSTQRTVVVFDLRGSWNTSGVEMEQIWRTDLDKLDRLLGDQSRVGIGLATGETAETRPWTFRVISILPNQPATVKSGDIPATSSIAIAAYVFLAVFNSFTGDRFDSPRLDQIVASLTNNLYGGSPTTFASGKSKEEWLNGVADLTQRVSLVLLGQLLDNRFRSEKVIEMLEEALTV